MVLASSCAISLILAMTACGGSSGPAAPPDPKPAAAGSAHSMKGWELYSWRDGAAVRYALVEGTNRNKAPAEVRQAAVADIDQQLATLAPGEEVFWSTSTGFELPDAPARQHLVELAQRLQLKLTVTP